MLSISELLFNKQKYQLQDKFARQQLDTKQPKGDYALKSEIPNTASFITKAVNDLTNYYTKTQTYTQSEIDEKISLIPKFSIEVISSFPLENISTTTVYLLKSGEESNNLYTEYIYINGKWEQLGTQKLDLTGYAKKEDIVQPDWNQNDKMAKDFVKNRPFYSKDPVETVWLEEQVLTTDESGTGQLKPFNKIIKPNTKYLVTIDGITTEYISFGFQELLYIGPQQTEENFPLSPLFMVEGDILLYALSPNVSPTVSIKEAFVENVKLDEKYIPNELLVGRKDNKSIFSTGEVFNNYFMNIATGTFSHAEGTKTKATGDSSHTEGSYTEASEVAAHAEGLETKATGKKSHAEGNWTAASGESSHAEGWSTTASGEVAHAEGFGATASGFGAHAEGNHTKAIGENSHTEGEETEATGRNSHVQGKFNVNDIQNKYAHIVGNGKSNKNRSNAHTLDWNGNSWYQGDVLSGGTSMDDPNAISLKGINNKVNDLPKIKKGAGELSETYNDILPERVSGVKSHAEGSQSYEKEFKGVGIYNIDPITQSFTVDNPIINKEPIPHKMELYQNGELKFSLINYKIDEVEDFDQAPLKPGDLVKLGTLYRDGKKEGLPDGLGNGQTSLPSENKVNFEIRNTEWGSELQWRYAEVDNKKYLVCDRNIVTGISWDTLNAAGFVEGKTLTIDGKQYKCRIMTGGTDHDGTWNDAKDKNNEWNKIIVNGIGGIGNGNDIWHWQDVYSWCQELKPGTSGRVVRGYNSASYWDYSNPSNAYANYGFRPLLEILPPSNESSDPNSKTPAEPLSRETSIETKSLESTPNLLDDADVGISGFYSFSDISKLTKDFYDIKIITGFTTGDRSHLEGNNNIITAREAHAEGWNNLITSWIDGNGKKIGDGVGAHVEGRGNAAVGRSSHAEGVSNQAFGTHSHAEGERTKATGKNSHAEGHITIASGNNSHAEGDWTEATGESSHAEGTLATAFGTAAHAEGDWTEASGAAAHAEGTKTIASGNNSHAEGSYTKASGVAAHAEGVRTQAIGSVSHAEGSYTIASGEDSHVQGKFNINDTQNKYAHIVGNGNWTGGYGPQDKLTRSNAHTLDWNGNSWYQGDVLIGGKDMDDPAAISLKKVYEQLQKPSADLSSVVTLSEEQTITGKKTFSNGAIINGVASTPELNQGLIVDKNIHSNGNITATGDIAGNRVHNAIWNDYAEWFEKENIEDIFEPGDICAWNENGVVLANKSNGCPSIGVVSDSYGIILGGEKCDKIENNEEKFVPIGLTGRVYVKVKGKIKKGDYITISKIDGVGKKARKNAFSKNILGIALESSNETEVKKIKILIK